jgi:hypothetical protein
VLLLLKIELYKRFDHYFNILLSVKSQFVVIFALKSSIYDLRNIKKLAEPQTDIF